MKKDIKNEMKHQYVAPTLIKLGDISMKTLGGHYYRYDSMSTSTACMDNSTLPGDICHEEYYGS